MWVRLVPITHTCLDIWGFSGEGALTGQCTQHMHLEAHIPPIQNGLFDTQSDFHPIQPDFFFWECRGNFTSLFSVNTQSRFKLPVFSLPYVICINYTSEKLRISEPVVLDKHVSQNQNIMSQVLLEKSAGSRVEVTKEGECLACPGKTWGESRESFTAETGSWMWKGKLVFTTKTSSTGIIIGYDFSVNIYTRPQVFKV